MTWEYLEKSGSAGGGGQHYDEDNLFYDAVIDVDTDNVVYYDGLGSSGTWTNINKT